MQQYRRPSPLELTYLAQDTPDASPVVNQYLLEGQGTLSLATLQQAVETASRAIVETRMVLRGTWRWRRWVDALVLPRVTEMDGGAWDGCSGEHAPVLGRPLDCRVGPVSEVVLLRGNPVRILFRTHHATMDGAGTLFFMRQVFRALRGETVEPSTSCMTEWDVARSHANVVRDTALGGCKPPYLPHLDAGARGCHWQRFVLPGAPAGLGGRVMGVVAQWAWERGEERMVVRMPADLRRYLPKGEFTASNCSAALDIAIQKGQDPKQMQQTIVKAMRHQQDLASIIPALGWLHWLPLSMLTASDGTRRKIHASGQYGYTCTITNLGRVDLSTLSCTDFHCEHFFGVPIPLELTPLYVAFIQYGNTSSMHLAIPRALGSAGDLAALCEKMRQALDQTG